jgi:hypothetical protein
MDVFLGAEARRALDGLRLIAGRTRPAGLLLGHRRGPRYFVEGIFTAGPDFGFSPAAVRRLDALFGGRVLGFFAFRPGAPTRRALLRPSAVGRVFIAVGGRGAMSAAAIDFDGRFLLRRLPLDSGKKAGNRE